MTAALSEWVKCYWIKFILNCTESKWVASSVTLVCTESQTTLNLWHHSRSCGSRKFWKSNLEFFFFFFYEVMAIRQPKHPSPWFWLLEYFRHHTVFSECSRVCSHSCVYVFPLRAISEGQSVSNFEPNMSQRVWHGTCLFCFCKIEFCCKMHMREFCTEVTIVP